MYMGKTKIPIIVFNHKIYNVYIYLYTYFSLDTPLHIFIDTICAKIFHIAVCPANKMYAIQCE